MKHKTDSMSTPKGTGKLKILGGGFKEAGKAAGTKKMSKKK